MQRPNVLLIVLDATRADACSCYGAARFTTPALDRLASEGVLFEQAISPAPWTLLAVASLLTGLYPGQLGLLSERKLGARAPTLPQVLAENGYAAFGITNNSWMSAAFGMQRGFQVMHKQWQVVQTAHEINRVVLTQRGHDGWAKTLLRELGQGNALVNLVNMAFTRFLAYRFDLGAARVLRPTKRWIEAQDKPWFALVHYLEAHLPYRPPLRWVVRFTDDVDRARHWLRADQERAEWHHITGVSSLSERDLNVWRALYAAEVAYTDHHMGRLIDWLRDTGQLDDTLVIVVADHGENLGEHGLLGHRFCVYDTLLHVPLVVRYPPLFAAGERVRHQVQTLDLFRTVLDIAGVGIADDLARRSILGSSGRPFTVAEYDVPRAPHPRDFVRLDLELDRWRRFERGLTALRTDEHKLIVGTDGSTELYDLVSDPGEVRNLHAERPEVVHALRRKLDGWRERHSPIGSGEEHGDVDPDVASRLRALGYLG